MLTGQQTYAAYIAAVEGCDLAEAITAAMWTHLHPAEQHAWEEVATYLDAAATHGRTLPVRRRMRAWCAVCHISLDADAVRCADHPADVVHLLLED